MDPTEKRRYRRIPVYLPVRLLTPAGRNLETLTKDIGAGGLRCILCEEARNDDAFSLEMVLPGEMEPLQIEAQKVWSRPLPQSSQFETGLRFAAIKTAAASNLNRYLNQKSAVAAHASR